jgi:hypothetical protein
MGDYWNLIIKTKPKNYERYTFTKEDYQELGDISSLSSDIRGKIWDIAQENHLFYKNFGMRVRISIYDKESTYNNLNKDNLHGRNIYILSTKKDGIIHVIEKDKIGFKKINPENYFKSIKFFSLNIQPIFILDTIKELSTLIESLDIKEGDIYPLVVTKDNTKILKLDKIFKYIPNLSLEELIKTPLIKSNFQNIFYDESYEDPLFLIFKKDK